ncbi:hypothetical protein B0T22DRAFT_179069 [Podospora appendiculata]|uniref:DUF676 domain-containing protein n=1 Tax=Podospora appendiculata TaxID=314037 RepID=A0AAE0XBV0_9PEZI|nr:hypothetical protein B0T22DRAFT_179069 [Podospora appendiculata]
MGSINMQISRYELTTVYHHPQAKADIVLVHGLNGDPQKTWTAKNNVFWPADLLPASLKKEHANILVYGYNADVYSTRKDRSPSDNFVHQHAQSLVTSLTQYRKSEGTERNPIIWVAHSLGGIVTKRALLYSNDVRAHHQEDFRSIFVSTYGIVFLGTPHTGSDLATWGRVLQHMSDVVVPRKFFETESVLLKTLKKDNETLQSINSHFLDIYQRFRIHMVHEGQTTDMKGTKVLVVDASSASPQLPGVTYYGIEATHSGMCKFESANAPGYRNVSTAIREWVANSPEVIEVRWDVEEDDRRLRANLENFERSRPYDRALSPAQHHEFAEGSNEITLLQAPPEIAAAAQAVPSLPAPSPLDMEHIRILESSQAMDAPLFIHPEPFRPNSLFVGREDELRGLHEMLMDRKRRSEGTSAVLIQCLPGGGKTHLARQYVFQHRDDYPGGVYWVRAKSRHEMESWFWRIAKNEALKGLVDRKDVKELRDPKKIVQIVRKWLNSQSDWLVVFDGVQFDTPGLLEFIPDARNTSMIYTSTERAVTGDPRFDNPQVMELGLLTAQQAQDLLLLEMDRKQPTAEDQARALELVQLMGRLPLMIHVAAQHLKATREPLAKYLKSYKSRPKAGGLPAYKAVRDQLENRGANAALNLISILVFFDQHIPVEMLILGLSALDKVTPIKTCDASHKTTNLNNTLKILIAFALIERTESDDISPASSRSSKRSFDKHVDYLDLLRIHSVVQAFFIDTLNEQREVHFWLERAISIWCRSYDEAHKRIIENPGVGLPDDYRRFSIHGQRLLQSLNRFEKKAPELLGAARAQVESRLRSIQGEIDHLSQAIQASIIDGKGETHPASVFERANSLSETDSAMTFPSNDSGNGWEPYLRDGDMLDQLQSPSTYEAPLASPSDWKAPYPTNLLMPPAPDVEDEDDRQTIVPPATLAVPDTADVLTPADITSSIVLSPEEIDNLRSEAYEDWQEVIPNHRVIKRNELRRYHDRAGAWRDVRTVSDPRVGVSLEVATGSLSSRAAGSRSPSRHRLTAQSDAEMELNKIKQAANPLPLPAENGPGRNPSSGNLARLLQSEGDFVFPSPDFSSGLQKMGKAAIKKLKDNLIPTQSALPCDPGSPTRQSQLPQVEDDDLMVAPGPIFRGSRTANSSPAGSSSPFAPPPLQQDLARPGLPRVVRRWDTTAHPIGLSRSDESWGVDPLSLSYPSLPQAADRNHYTGTRHRSQPQAWIHTPAPSGYTSQPMSRNPSHQSNNNSQVHLPSLLHNSHEPPVSPGSVNSNGSRRKSSGQGTAATHHSSPLAAGSPDIHATAVGNTGSGTRLIPLGVRHRRPSYTETEPSPRLDAAFPDVDTSYQRWEQLHNQQTNTTMLPRHQQLLQHEMLPGTPTAGPNYSSNPLLPGANSSSAPIPAVRWNHINPRGGGGGVARGRERRGRSQSQSPSPSPSPSSRSSGGRQQQHHPNILALGGAFIPPVAGGSPELLGGGFYGHVPPGGGGGGEPMSRSASGGSGGSVHSGGAGIRVGDGRRVEFGGIRESGSGSGIPGPSGSAVYPVRKLSDPVRRVSLPVAGQEGGGGGGGSKSGGGDGARTSGQGAGNAGHYGLGILD